MPLLIDLTCLLFHRRGYSRAVGAGPIRGPALVRREVCGPRTRAPSCCQSRASQARHPSSNRTFGPDGRHAFRRWHVRAAARGATDPRPCFRAARRLSAQVGPAPLVATGKGDGPTRHRRHMPRRRVDSAGGPLLHAQTGGAEHDLSQRGLAQRLGMKHPQVARLELGDVNPTIDTLMRISSRLLLAARCAGRLVSDRSRD